MTWRTGGSLPVVACLGESPTGQVMNINADIAARELIWEVKPHKIIFLTGTGGLLDESGRIISAISLRTDYDYLVEQDWVHSGMQLKLEQISQLLCGLPEQRIGFDHLGGQPGAGAVHPPRRRHPDPGR